jgi:hypothetical protein
MGEIFTKALEPLWQVLVAGLVLGAGLPALFALGIRVLGTGRTVAADGGRYTSAPTGAGRAVSSVLFGVCAAAVLFGIVVIVFGSQIFGK